MYQGRLNDGGNPANGNYDLRFTVYDAVTNGNAVSPALTNSATAVSNGLFTVSLDFGPGIFTGLARWLDIGVRTNGSASAFTSLTPRQPILAVPYAIFAGTASNLSGTLPAAQLSGTLPASAFVGYTGTVVLTNGDNLFGGAFSGTFNGLFSGAFAGNGAAVTNVNVTNLTGVLADYQLPANTAFVNSNQTFVGTNLFTGFNVFSGPTNSFNGAFSGNGINLTNLNGSQITTGTVADARLTTNVALLNRNQTFTGNNVFNGANTFTNLYGNSFSGSFFGNGLVGWIATNGTTIQATIDTGYLLTNSQLVTVTLPVSPHPGDIVRISGAGAGGWLVTENSGQSILGNFASYGNSSPVGLPVSGNYQDVAASADGTRMYAVGNGLMGVQASSDSGRDWSQAGNLAPYCQSVACSANGRIVYVVTTADAIYISTNSGALWTLLSGSATAISCTANGNNYFTGNIACSGNGTYLATFTSSSISVSTNGGASFSVNVPVPSANLSCLAVSGDCTHLVAGVNNGLLYGSANLGATWTSITTSNQVWSGAWMSPDGSKFAATVSTSGGTTGGIYDYAVYALAGTISTNSTISGSQGTAVELQYLGGGQFTPVSSAGTIWAF